MSNYNSTLQSNNTDLQTILNSINNLPDAGGEQATPVISVSSNGLITATTGTKTSTHQLAFQSAKTITPSTTSQIAVSSGYYTGGDVMVAGDSELVAGNIKSGVSIFGVTGTYVGGGGNTDIEDSFVTKIISTYTNDRVTSISDYVFAYCSSLTSVSFPKVATIGRNAFQKCYNLKSLYLTGSSVCKLSESNAFSSTPIGGYSASAGTYGSIYVPASLLTSYQTATNWTYFSSRFVAFDGGDTGNLITFTIDGTQYQAEEGMTWTEWAESEYNTIGLICTETMIFNHEAGTVLGCDNIRVYPNQIISDNEQYILSLDL